MKAAVITKFAGPGSITIADMPIPKPQAGEIQVKVHAAGVNPADWKIAEGLFKERIEYQFPIILGWDCAGEVAEVGAGVKDFKPGDKVFACCIKDEIGQGSYAEYICLDANNVAKMPKNLSFEQAAVIPLAVLTAWQGLHEQAKIKKGDHILIHAGAGGVGAFAIQIAKKAGAHVISTGRKKNHDYIASLGADEIIDYSTTPVNTHLKEKVDILFDTVGGQTLEEAYELVKPDGFLMTIAGQINEHKLRKHGIRGAWFMIHPERKGLEVIRELIESGSFICPPVQPLPLEKAADALNLSRERHVRGKLVLTIN